MASVGCWLFTDFEDPESLRALLASRLIPVDKRPGVHPTGVGEVMRRIIWKAVMSVVKTDVLAATVPLQLCAGWKEDVRLRFIH